jgi:hypothetical protein
MMPRRTLFAGNVYSHDSWDHYREGHLNRVNGNLGTVSTQTDAWFADYGVTSRLNVIVQVPYIWTHASQGVLSGMQGFQDITFAAKYAFLERPFTKYGSLKAIVVGSGAIPLTNYNFDFEPLSIGTQSKRISGRFTLNYQTRAGWFGNGSAAYTFRDDVNLDRPYYFTENQLFLTNKVQMPNVFDYVLSGGYHKRGIMAQAFFTQQRTQGGGDIRRQDAPFVSNMVNDSKVGVLFMYPLPIPKLRDFTAQFSWARVVDGRNVGESTTITTGLLYTLRFHGAPIP